MKGKLVNSKYIYSSNALQLQFSARCSPVGKGSGVMPEESGQEGTASTSLYVCKHMIGSGD